MRQTELELRAAFLREMLAPLVESLSSGLAGNAGMAGQDVYEYFVSEALSRPLAEGWPLPPIASNAGALLGGEGSSSVDATLAALSRGRAPARRAPEAVSAALGTGIGAIESGLRLDAGAARTAPTSSTSTRSASTTDTPTVEPRRDGAPFGTPPGVPQGTPPGAPSGTPPSTPLVPGSAASSGARAVLAGGSGTQRARLDELVAGAAREFALPESLLQAMVQVESSGNPLAVSPKGAQGLLQLMPGTARDVGVEDPFDPEQNLRGGAAYLAQQIERFGDLPRALAAYNAGPGAVAKHGGIPPYPETRAYVDRVLGLAQQLEQ